MNTWSSQELDVNEYDWSQVGYLIQPRKHSGVISFGDKLWIIGGILASGKPTSSIEEFNVKSRRSKILSVALPKAKSNFSCLYHNGYIYLAGGNIKGYSITQFHRISN